ncbi:hypothetical protein MNV49_001624 [Pseudohyphozyma bogoriensis]|nr:hypothetical protein MNV49_001624 [Pseudohyphozyma bogoriensis]
MSSTVETVNPKALYMPPELLTDILTRAAHDASGSKNKQVASSARASQLRTFTLVCKEWRQIATPMLTFTLEDEEEEEEEEGEEEEEEEEKGRTWEDAVKDDVFVADAFLQELELESIRTVDWDPAVETEKDRKSRMKREAELWDSFSENDLFHLLKHRRMVGEGGDWCSNMGERRKVAAFFEITAKMKNLGRLGLRDFPEAMMAFQCRPHVVATLALPKLRHFAIGKAVDGFLPLLNDTNIDYLELDNYEARQASTPVTLPRLQELRLMIQPPAFLHASDLPPAQIASLISSPLLTTLHIPSFMLTRVLNHVHPGVLKLPSLKHLTLATPLVPLDPIVPAFVNSLRITHLEVVARRLNPILRDALPPTLRHFTWMTGLWSERDPAVNHRQRRLARASSEPLKVGTVIYDITPLQAIGLETLKLKLVKGHVSLHRPTWNKLLAPWKGAKLSVQIFDWPFESKKLVF